MPGKGIETLSHAHRRGTGLDPEVVGVARTRISPSGPLAPGGPCPLPCPAAAQMEKEEKAGGFRRAVLGTPTALHTEHPRSRSQGPEIQIKGLGRLSGRGASK